MESDTRFNVDATVRWVSGVLRDPAGTALAFHGTGPSWQVTFLQITLPVYVAASVAGFVLSWLFDRPFMFGAPAAAPLWFLMSLVWSLASVFVVAFIFDLFAGVFDGKRNFDAAFAAVSLALVPAAAGGVLSPLPWLGWLIALAAGIYGLVLLYRFVPVFMAVPEAKRVLHFVVSVVVTFVVNILISGIIAAACAPLMLGDLDQTDSGTSTTGMFGGFERQADIAEQAAQDSYDPPGHGRVSKAQMTDYVRVLQRTAELRERLGKRFENVDEENVSLGDLFGGVSDAVRLGTAEMEVVKTAGGNWAEHQWVKNQIETARVQKDSSPAVEHNYKLFLDYRDRIEAHE